MKVRRRAPGGGRKQKDQSEVLRPLSIRIKRETRARLEAAARANKTNVSREIERRVKLSFDQKPKKLADKDPALRALRFLFETLASDVVGFWDGDRPRYDWRSNRFFFLAYKQAVADLFMALDPGGACKSPSDKEIKENPVSVVLPEFSQSFQSPEARGTFALKMLWLRLMNANPDTDLSFLDELPDSDQLKGEIQESNYGMKNARKDLLPKS